MKYHKYNGVFNFNKYTNGKTIIKDKLFFASGCPKFFLIPYVIFTKNRVYILARDRVSLY